jgi:hypothetical protein
MSPSESTAPGARAPAVLGRVTAGLALVSAAIHLLTLDPGSLGSLATLAMAAACLPCAWHLWRSPKTTVWQLTAGLDAAMLLLHVQAGPATSHAHPVGAPSPEGTPLMWAGLAVVCTSLFVSAAVLAGSALTPRLRRSTPSSSHLP